MKKDKRFRVNFPALAHYEVRVDFTSNLKRALGRHKETKNVDLSGPDDRYTDALAIHVSGEGRSFVFFKHGVTVGTIAHEAWHVVRHVLTYIGAELENEVVAYHLGYLVNEIVRHAKITQYY